MLEKLRYSFHPAVRKALEKRESEADQQLAVMVSQITREKCVSLLMQCGNEFHNEAVLRGAFPEPDSKRLRFISIRTNLDPDLPRRVDVDFGRSFYQLYPDGGSRIDSRFFGKRAGHARYKILLMEALDLSVGLSNFYHYLRSGQNTY